MIHGLIDKELSSLNVPVAFKKYTGDEETFITFFEYDEGSAMDADDREIATSYYYQINIFSKTDYGTLLKQVKEKMIALGGTRLSEGDVPNMNSEYHQRTIRFRFTL
jgi:hypothetical protein